MFFMENWRKLSQNYHQILLLIKTPGLWFCKADNGIPPLTARMLIPLRKHAYSNILKILPPKMKIFRSKILIFFHTSAQNIDCGYLLEPPRWGGSNKFPQSMFLSRNKKNNVYPCKPQFYYIKVGFKGSKLYRHVFVMTDPDLSCLWLQSPVAMHSFLIILFDCPIK